MKFVLGRRGPDPRFEWHKWFAWYPVRYPDFRTSGLDSSRTYVWLKTLERRRCTDDGYMSYGEDWWEYRYVS